MRNNHGFNFNNAIIIDGVNDYCQCGLEPNNLFNLTTGFSISFWVKWNTNPNYGIGVNQIMSQLWAKKVSVVTTNPGIGVYTSRISNVSVLDIRMSDGTTPSAPGIIVPIANFSSGWNNVIIRVKPGTTTLSSTLADFMLNGVFGAAAGFTYNGTAPGNMALGLATADPLRLSRTTANAESHYLDEFAIYSKFLTVSESLWLYNNKIGSPALRLAPTLLYEFNQSAGPTLLDTSGNGYNASMVNFVGSPFVPH